MSKIQWTQETWNPIIGCDIASSGCAGCYAARDAARKALNPRMPAYSGIAEFRKNSSATWTGIVRENSETQVMKPLKTKKPTTFFLASMGDVFHEEVSPCSHRKIFEVIHNTPHHTYQILTKRPQNIPSVMQKLGIDRMPQNVWLGVSVESQHDIDVETKQPVITRIDHLQKIPTDLRFLSIEPLIGPLRLSPNQLEGISWVIIGGESGPKERVRPFDLDAAKLLIDDIDAAEKAQNRFIPIFVKQMGKLVRQNGKLIEMTFKWGRDDLPPSDWPEWAIRRTIPMLGVFRDDDGIDVPF